MKRFLIASLIGVLCLPVVNVFAQSETKTVSSRSQRYSLVVPDDWYVTNEVQALFSDATDLETPFNLASIQKGLPLDSVVMADSERTVDSFLTRKFDFTAPETYADFEGAVLFSIYIPAYIVDMIPSNLGGNLDSLMEDIDLPADSSFELEHAELEQAGLTGSELRVFDGKVTISMRVLPDAAGNNLWIIWASDGDHLADLEAILASLSIQAFDAEMLTNAARLDIAVVMIPEVLEIYIPPGWWLIQSSDTAILTPDLDIDFLATISGEMLGEKGVILVATLVDSYEFTVEPYDENGQLNPELMSDLITLFLNQSPPGSLETTLWSNGEGLAGLEAEFEQTSVRRSYDILLLDTGGEQFTVLIGFSDPDTWRDYKEVIKAIIDTARMVSD